MDWAQTEFRKGFVYEGQFVELEGGVIATAVSRIKLDDTGKPLDESVKVRISKGEEAGKVKTVRRDEIKSTNSMKLGISVKGVGMLLKRMRWEEYDLAQREGKQFYPLNNNASWIGKAYPGEGKLGYDLCQGT